LGDAQAVGGVVASYGFTIFADYFQFVAMDESSQDDFASIWTDESLERMLAVGKTAVCPGTLRNIDVDVEVRIEESEPIVDVAAFDHVAEASVDIPSGSLVVMSCTGHLPDAPRIKVSPGVYRVLSLACGTNTIKTEWEPAKDKYIVYFWPGNHRAPRLIKHWKGGASVPKPSA
jgi:hypothetical protein